MSNFWSLMALVLNIPLTEQVDPWTIHAKHVAKDDEAQATPQRPS